MRFISILLSSPWLDRPLPPSLNFSGEDRSCLADSLKCLDPHKLAAEFYDRLFTELPTLHIPELVADQRQGGDQFYQYVKMLPDNAGCLDEIVPRRLTLSLYRSRYGIAKSHYRVIAAIFLTVLEDQISIKLDPHSGELWRRLVDELVERLEGEAAPPFIPDYF